MLIGAEDHHPAREPECGDRERRRGRVILDGPNQVAGRKFKQSKLTKPRAQRVLTLRAACGNARKPDSASAGHAKHRVGETRRTNGLELTDADRIRAVDPPDIPPC